MATGPTKVLKAFKGIKAPKADLCRGKAGAHPNDTKHREGGTTLKVFGSAFFKKRRRKSRKRKSGEEKRKNDESSKVDEGIFV